MDVLRQSAGGCGTDARGDREACIKELTERDIMNCLNPPQINEKNSLLRISRALSQDEARGGRARQTRAQKYGGGRRREAAPLLEGKQTN